jgi:hypothetical protein
MSIFLAGLNHNTQMHVRMFNPTSIAHAANLAKLHELGNETMAKPSSKYSYTYPKTPPILPKPITPLNTMPSSSQTPPTP